MVTCKFCGGCYANQASATKHLDVCRVFKLLEREKMYNERQHKVSQPVIINNTYINNSYTNCNNTNTINTFNMNIWQGNTDKYFINFENKIKEFLGDPIQQQILKNCSIVEIKNNIKGLLNYFLKVSIIDNNFNNLIKGKEFILDLDGDLDENKCVEYVNERANQSVKSLTNEIKKISGKNLSDDIFKELDVD